jgi:plasmid stability protein
MSQLVVRNLPPELVARLKWRAGQHGVSAEAEHREILREALLGTGTPSLKALLAEMPDLGDDEDFARAPSRRRRVRP